MTKITLKQSESATQNNHAKCSFYFKKVVDQSKGKIAKIINLTREKIRKLCQSVMRKAIKFSNLSKVCSVRHFRL